MNPGEATTTKPSYYPVLNRLGFILERIRSRLLSRHAPRKSNEQIHMHDDETTESSVTLPDGSVPSNANPMMLVSSCSLTQHHEVMPSSSYLPTQTITPQVSTESSTISAPKLIDTETTSYSIESNVSSSLASSLPPVVSTTNTVSNNIHSTPSSCKVDPVATSSDTVQTPHKAMSQPSVSKIPKSHSKQPRNRVQEKSSTKPKTQSRKESIQKPAPDNKGDFMSWVKRKLSPEKDADTTTIAKQSRNDTF